MNDVLVFDFIANTVSHAQVDAELAGSDIPAASTGAPARS